MKVTVCAPVRPTEDPAKVEEAARRFFPDGTVRREGDVVELTSSDLRTLRARVWELRIIDTVRGKLLHGLAPDGRALSFRLSKQAALAGKVSFPATPHALGDLDCSVVVEDGDPWPDAERLAWWVCPETKDGEIVGPTG